MKAEDIRALVIGIIEEYGTNDPFQLADFIDIQILYHDLPDSLNAYRLDKVFVINSKLEIEDQRWILAHEIGHYFLHGPNETLSRYIKNKLLIKSKMEKEADIFASELMLADINSFIIEGLTLEQLASLFSVPKKYVELKLRR